MEERERNMDMVDAAAPAEQQPCDRRRRLQLFLGLGMFGDFIKF